MTNFICGFMDIFLTSGSRKTQVVFEFCLISSGLYNHGLLTFTNIVFTLKITKDCVKLHM